MWCKSASPAAPHEASKFSWSLKAIFISFVSPIFMNCSLFIPTKSYIRFVTLFPSLVIMLIPCQQPTSPIPFFVTKSIFPFNSLLTFSNHFSSNQSCSTNPFILIFNHFHSHLIHLFHMNPLFANYWTYHCQFSLKTFSLGFNLLTFYFLNSNSKIFPDFHSCLDLTKKMA
jgi:hypothetical protein